MFITPATHPPTLHQKAAPGEHPPGSGRTGVEDLTGSPDQLEPDGELDSLITQLYQTHLPLTGGKPSKTVHGRTPHAAEAFSICAVTVGGSTVHIGDSQEHFPLLSITKPFVYGLALEQCGLDTVRKKIGVEPTGTAFNSLLRQEEISRGRYNPMVNLGAIATSSLIKGQDPVDRQRLLLEMFERYCGRELEIDPQAADHRHRHNSLAAAMAYFMDSEGLLTAPVAETLELYHAQCSVTATCRDLAVMAATLANAGTNPLTGIRALPAHYVKNVLSVMFSSGLYDLSGQWAYSVGLPAKSGLAGAILAVVPGKMGVAVYSPKLDSKQRSVRGVRVLTEFSEQLRTHVFSHASTKPGNPQNAAPSTPQPRVVEVLDELHRKHLSVKEGRPYASDPKVVEIDPNRFGICAVSVDGRVQGVGDWNYPFLLQSLSKVFVYGMALEDRGREFLQRRVGVEPTGDPFDGIIKLEQQSKRPFNPMVNTGGIATTSLIQGRSRAHRLQRIQQMYARYAGQEVQLNAPALLAEQSGGDRNRAISHLLRHFGMVNGAVEDALDLYLQQCSVMVTARDLAVMAATLAGGGVNPLTGVRAINRQYVKDLLSVMFTCGMYDFAGAWAYQVGLPAKSGVGGGIMAVVPGEMGIAVFSPPLDERGNSVRGIRVFEELSQRLKLHTFEPIRN